MNLPKAPAHVVEPFAVDPLRQGARVFAHCGGHDDVLPHRPFAGALPPRAAKAKRG